jgi:hypothetical protein
MLASEAFSDTSSEAYRKLWVMVAGAAMIDTELSLA